MKEYCRRRWLIGVLVLVVGIAAAVVGLRPLQPTVPGPRVTEVVDQAAAFVEARRQHENVAVASLTTPTRRVSATPTGTLEAEVSMVPAWVRRGDGWIPADPTLRTTSTGLTTTATDGPVTFSAGGTQPMATYGGPGQSLTMTWPTALPTPKVDGKTATYADVLPGVDLVLTAETYGMSQHLVVKTAEAAKNPALRAIKLGLAVDGLTVTADQNGVLEAKDRAGNPVLRTQPTTMWDAGDRQAAVHVDLSGTELTLRPDLDLLTDPTATFPVTIDPNWATLDHFDWTKVFSKKATSTHWYGADDVDSWGKVGLCTGLRGCTTSATDIGVARTYLQFDTRFLAGKRILGATLDAAIVYGPACNIDRPHQLWMANATINQGTNWNNAPGGWWVDTQTAQSAYDNCPGNKGIGFNVNKNNGLCTTCWSVYFMKAENENDNQAWRKYDAFATRLRINYNSSPDAPSNMRTDPPMPTPCKWCGGVPYLADDHVRLIGTLTDPDPDNLTAIWDVYGGSTVEESEGPTQYTGSTFSKTVDLTKREGQNISWTLWARDPAPDGGPWRNGPGLPFRVDLHAPDKSPGVTGDLYQSDNSWHGGVGVPGTFTLTAGVSDVDHFKYGWSSPPTTPVDADALGGKAVISTAPTKDGAQTLYVKSFDRAGNESPTTEYHTYVRAGNGPLAQWSYEGNAKDTAFLASHDGTTVGAINYSPGAVGSALALDDPGEYMSAPNVIRTDTSFSVSAWARLDQARGAAILMSQDGSVNSGFFLTYRDDPAGGMWEFSLPSADAVQRPDDSFVQSGHIARLGEWTQLTGVYDASAKQMRLYVNGVLAGSGPRANGFNATGAFQVGRGKWQGGLAGSWPGAVDEVKAYDRVLAPAEIQAAVSRDNVQLGYWKFDDNTGTTAVNSVGGSAGVLQDGAQFAPTGAVNGSLQLDGKGYVTTGAPVVRTDQSFSVSTWVKQDVALPAGNPATAVSQDGALPSGFYLGYRQNTDTPGGKWEFLLPTADAKDPVMEGVWSSSAAKLGSWTHLTGVYNAQTHEVRLYVDGVLAGTAARVQGFNATGPLTIGRGKWNGNYGNWVTGGVDEVRAYGRVLSDEEIKGIVSRDNVAVGQWKLDGNLKDAGPKALNGTATAPDYTGGQTSMPDPTDLALRMDGTARGATSLPHAVDTNQSFSVAAWARMDDTGTLRTVLSEDGSSISGFKLRARDDGRWGFVMFDGDAPDDGTKRAEAIGGSIQLGQWTHLVGVYDATAKQAQLYVNGVLAGSVAHTHTWNATGGLQIGRAKWNGGPVEYFKGAIDDVAAYSRTLFAAEIQTMAGRDLTLIHDYPFDENTGRTSADAVGTKGATLGTGASFVPGRVGNAVHTTGTANGVASTSGIDLRVDQPFSVSALVHLPAKDCQLQTPASVCKWDAVTVDGAKTSKFRLGHVTDANNSEYGAWTFEMPESDADNAVVSKAAVSTWPSDVDQPGHEVWTHLVGVYDPALKKIWLYVNSDRVGDGTLNTPWQPSGGLVVGRGKVNGQPAEFWPGDVDDVRLYTGALSDDRITALFHSYPAQTSPATLPADETGRWNLDERTGTTTADASGRGQTATLSGATSWVGGRLGAGAVLLNGGSAQTAGPVLDTTRSFSASAWVYLNKTDTTQNVLGQDGSRTSAFFVGYSSDDDKWRLVVPKADADNAATTTVASTENAQASQWTHLAVTYDADVHQVRLYVNGLLSTVQVDVNVLPSAGAFTIGRGRWNGANTMPFNGVVDDVRVFNRVVTDDEVRKVHDDAGDGDFGYYRFDDGTATDSSWRKGVATVSGGATYGPGVPWAAGKALQLNGTTGYATGPQPRLPMRDSFTVTAWAKLTNDTQVSTVVSQDGDRNSGFVLQYRPDVGRWVFGGATADQDGARLVYVASPTKPAVNQWTSLAGVYDYPARRMSLYVNGELVATMNNAVLWPATGDTVFGRAKADGKPVGYFAGSLDEVRLAEGVVTDKKIAARGGWAAPQAGQLGRFVNAAGDHYTTGTDQVPAGYHFEGTMGRLVPQGDNTKAVYACRSGADSFTSADSGCEGATPLGQLGYVYTKQPTNISTIAVYQCAVSADRFESRLSTCEGATSKGVLGYTLGYGTLVRYGLDIGERLSTADGPPAAYSVEGVQGVISMAAQTGTQPLYSCQAGTDVYSSTDAACEGGTALAVTGHVWTAKPSDVDSLPLYRCKAGTDRFLSLLADCEGQTMDKQLGYTLAAVPNVTAVFP
jgi:hypothetical protein